MAQHAEVERHSSTDEDEQKEQELALLLEVGGACLEDDVADFEHRFVGFEFADLAELPETEEESDDDDGETPVEDGGVARSGETGRHFKVSFAGEGENRSCQR